MGNTGAIVARLFRHSCFFCILGSVALASAAFAEESHSGMNAEVLYSEAVLALSHKHAEEALSILDSLLKQYPGDIQAFELKALTLKREGDDAKAIGSYKKLIELKPSDERG